MNASDVVKYFCKKYREAYDMEYNVNWQREASMVKNKLVKTYSLGQIKDIIDLTFEQYERVWATQGYPRPTIGQLVTWIPNKALAIFQAREKKQADIEKAMVFSTPVFVAKTKQIRHSEWRQQSQILPDNSLIASV